MDKFLEKMKALNDEIAELEGKRAEEKDEAKKSVLVDMLKAKADEFEKLEGEVADQKAKDHREKMIAEINGDKKKVDKTKADQLADVKVLDSAHNRENMEVKKDALSWDILMDPLADGSTNHALRTADGLLLESIRGKTEGFKAPRSLAKFIVPQPTGYDLVEQYFGDRIASRYGAKQVVSEDATGVASGGGALFQDQFQPTIYRQERVVDDLPSRCWVKPDMGGNALFPRLSSQSASVPFGVTITWGDAGATQGEGKAITTSNPTYNQISIPTERLAALTQISLKELRVNQVGLEGQVAWMFRNGVSREISRRIIQGTGVAPFPTGVNSAASIALNLNLVPRQVVDAVSYTDLNELQFAVVSGLEEGGIYVISTGANGAMRFIAGLDDDQGRPILRGTDQFQAGLGVVRMLAGMPFVHTPANEAYLGARGDVIFGNWRNYGLVIGSVDIARSDQYAFGSGLVTFRVLTYVGGEPIDTDAFSVLADPKGASSSSSSSSSST